MGFGNHVPPELLVRSIECVCFQQTLLLVFLNWNVIIVIVRVVIIVGVIIIVVRVVIVRVIIVRVVVGVGVAVMVIILLP